MNKDLELLLKLQVIDFDRGELERSKAYLPDMMENLKREIEEAKESLEKAKTDLEESRKRQGQLELEISTKESELQKYQQQMMSIKTNKEYDALVAEIDATKTVISQNETELLETIEHVSQLEKEIEESTEKCAQIEENNAKQLEILQEKVDSIGDKMSDKEDERKSIKAEVPKSTLSVYERVRRGKGNDVVVVVKKRACGACYKALTPKKIQEVKKGDRINTCEGCGRLLFWDEDISN